MTTATGGVVDSRSSPRGRPVLLLGMALAAWLALPGVAAAEEAPPAEQTDTGQDDASSDAETAGATTASVVEQPGPSPLSLTVSPVGGDGADDGDLVTDTETGLPTLTFSPSTPAEQTAVLEFTVTNTGDAVLSDVVVTDDRVGTVLDAASDTTLAPGESVTVRAGATFTFEEAIDGTAGLVTTDAQVTASDDTGTAVEAVAQWTIQVVAVLPTPTATIELEALVGVGDVVAGVGGVPTISWSAEEAAVGDERTIHYRVTITNTGDVELADVTAVVDVLGARLSTTADGAVLAPGESTVAEVSRTLTPDEMGGDPATGVEVRAVADLQATDDTGQAVTATDDAVVLGVVVQPEEIQEEESLPAAGPRDDSGDLLVIAVLLLLLGADLLLVTRRRTVAAAPPGHRRETAWCRRD